MPRVEKTHSARLAAAKAGTAPKRRRRRRAAASAALSAEERQDLLERAVLASTDALPASMRSRTDFEAVLVRGTPVPHRRHLATMALLAGLLVAASLAAPDAALFEVLYLLPVGCGLYWLYLTFTRGERLERISVDEEGHVSRVGSWRGTGARADVLKVAVPAIVIVVAGWITFGLVHDIAHSPQPNCRWVTIYDSDYCNYIPGLGGATGFTVGEMKVLERAVRCLQLLYSTFFFLAAIWFVHRMLSGGWVFDMEPVHGPLEET